MQKIKAEHGPESVAMFNHGIGQRFIQHVLKSWGAINFAGPSFAQCRGPRDIGFVLTFGTGLGSPEPTDIENTDCLVLIGSHLGENMHNSQVQEFAKAIERRIPIIVVDPRFSVAASKAKYWLPIKPGTDLALMLAWMNVLVTEGRYDKAFVEKHGHGFDKFVAEIKDYTPEWAAAETGIDAAMIRATAREFARRRPATIIHPGRRVNWNGDDTQRSRAIALLSALLGNWGRKGGLFLQAGMKVAPYPAAQVSEVRQADGRQPQRRALSVRRRAGHHRHPRGDDHRQAVSDQGLVRLLDEHPERAAERGRDAEGDRQRSTCWSSSTPCPARSPATPTSCCRRPRSSSATTNCWPASAAAAGCRCASRWCPRRTTRSPAGGSRRSWPSKLGIPECMPFKDMEEYLALPRREVGHRAGRR